MANDVLDRQGENPSPNPLLPLAVVSSASFSLEMSLVFPWRSCHRVTSEYSKPFNW